MDRKMCAAATLLELLLETTEELPLILDVILSLCLSLLQPEQP